MRGLEGEPQLSVVEGAVDRAAVSSRWLAAMAATHHFGLEGPRGLWRRRQLPAQSPTAELLASMNRLADAEPHFVEALAIQPDYADARRNLGMLRQITGTGPSP